MAQSTNNLDLLTDGGLSDLLKISVRTIQRWAKRPDFPKPVYIGRSRRWPRSRVADYIYQTEPVGGSAVAEKPDAAD